MARRADLDNGSEVPNRDYRKKTRLRYTLPSWREAPILIVIYNPSIKLLLLYGDEVSCEVRLQVYIEDCDLCGKACYVPPVTSIEAGFIRARDNRSDRG